MSKIMALTADQESTFQHYIDRWTAIGLSTEPIDREKHDESICAIYKLAGLKEPRIVYVDCALSGAIASGILTDEGAMDSVMGSVWGSVWGSVRVSVGDSVRGSVIDSVRATKIKWVDWLYGNMWAGYGAWGEFFLEQCGVDVNRDCLNHMEHGHWIWPLDGLCLCSERPIAIYTDNQGRNHRENGPAVEYPTGWGPFVWHGTIVPPEWLLGKPPTAAEAIKWENMEQRRAACEILGWVNVLNELNARTIDKHKNYAVGELLEVDIPDIGKGRFLRVMCGTQREFALPVPLDMDTAENAQRWLNFIPDDIHFIPEVRT